MDPSLNEQSTGTPPDAVQVVGEAVSVFGAISVIGITACLHALSTLRSQCTLKNFCRWYQRQCTSELFWRIYPWIASISGLCVMWFFTFIYMLKYFAQDNDLMVLYLETVCISIGLGWFITTPMVIITRNNMKFTKKIMKSRKYQVIEKFVVVPLARTVATAWKAFAS
eukprot:4445849-Prymnesium_polylepis.1